MRFVYAVINLLILAGLIYLVGRKTIVKIFRSRREKITRELDEAETPFAPEPLRGLGALLRRFAAQFLLRLLERLRVGLTQLRFLCSALVRKAARFRFVFRACVLLRLARGLNLRIARIHKGQHRLKEQFFQNEHQREKA